MFMPKPGFGSPAAALLLTLLALIGPAKAGWEGRTGEKQLVDALAAEVESMAAQTRPPHWPLKRSCLYYALAGQVLLAQHGVKAVLRVGAVDYFPGTPLAHPIDPHVWLETDTYFIDYATLPRCGRVTHIPRDRLATAPEEVRPGMTSVLGVGAEPDRALTLYLRHHALRFRHWLRMQRVRVQSVP